MSLIHHMFMKRTLMFEFADKLPSDISLAW